LADNEQLRRLRDIVRLLVRRLGILERSEATCCGVTMAQCHALYELRGTGEMSLNDLAESLSLDKSTVSRSVDTLVGSGLVVRETDPGDRRCVNLRLTADGRHVLDNIDKGMDAFFAGIVDQLPAETRGQVIDSLALLAEAAANRKCCGESCKEGD
jgi:DNA-binding MarR family transcriptional regulator